MRYCIYSENENYYYILHKRNSYDLGTKKKVSKRNFLHWKQGKIDDTNYNNIKKLAISKAEPTKKTTMTPQEKEILEQLSKMLQDKSHILEGTITLDGHSKAFVGRTVRSEKLLKQYELERVRLNKELKQELNIKTKGFPFIIKTA